MARPGERKQKRLHAAVEIAAVDVEDFHFIRWWPVAFIW
jgi:hypothetical protein